MQRLPPGAGDPDRRAYVARDAGRSADPRWRAWAGGRWARVDPHGMMPLAWAGLRVWSASAPVWRPVDACPHARLAVVLMPMTPVPRVAIVSVPCTCEHHDLPAASFWRSLLARC